MKIKFAIVAMTGLALVGCNRGATNNSASAGNNSATANAATPAAPAAPAATGTPVDQAFLVGHWGPPGNCSSTVSFNADGTAQATGEKDARWKLEGGNLVIEEPGKPAQPTPVSRSGENLIVSGPQGQTAALTRCPSAGTAGPGAGAGNSAGEAETEEPSE